MFLSCLSQRKLKLNSQTFEARMQHDGFSEFFSMPFYTLRRCTLVLNQGRSLPPLPPTYTASILCSYHILPVVRILLRGTPCFTRYSRDQSDPTFRRALHNSNTFLRGGKAATTQLNSDSTLNTALSVLLCLGALPPIGLPLVLAKFMREATLRSP